MQEEILKEIQEIKTILAKLIGTADRSVENRFSEEALDNAARLFLKMSTERGDWVTDSEVPRCLGTSLWNAGSFIRNEFAFSNWFKKGREYLYSKKDLLALGQELK